MRKRIHVSARASVALCGVLALSMLASAAASAGGRVAVDVAQLNPPAGRTIQTPPSVQALSPALAAQAKQRSGASADDAMREQKDVYKQTNANALRNLLNAGYAADAALKAMQRIFAMTPEDAVRIGRTVITGVQQFVRATTVAFREKGTAWLFENLVKVGIDPKVAALDLKSLAGLTMQVVAVTMNRLKLKAEPLMEIARDVYGLTAEQAANAAKAAGYAAEPVAKALKWAYKVSARAAAAIMRSVYNLSVHANAAVLKAAGWTADQTADALRHAHNASAAVVAGAMKAAGWTRDTVAKALRFAKFSAEQVAGALKAGFNTTVVQTAQALQAAGFPLAEIQQAIVRAYNMALAQVVTALAQAGIK